MAYSVSLSRLGLLAADIGIVTKVFAGVEVFLTKEKNGKAVAFFHTVNLILLFTAGSLNVIEVIFPLTSGTNSVPNSLSAPSTTLAVV